MARMYPEDVERWTEAQIQSLVYVAATRARHHLVIPYAQTNAVVERLLACRT